MVLGVAAQQPQCASGVAALGNRVRLHGDEPPSSRQMRAVEYFASVGCSPSLLAARNWQPARTELGEWNRKTEGLEDSRIAQAWSSVPAGSRMDFEVSAELVVEIEAVEALPPVLEAQLISYLRLTRIPAACG